MDRLLYSSMSSTGRKLISTKVQSDLKQRTVEEKIQLFPTSITQTKAQINYAVIPISSCKASLRSIKLFEGSSEDSKSIGYDVTQN